MGMAIPDWQWQYFGGSPQRRRMSRFGLIAAPMAERPSAALLESRAEMDARQRRDRDWDRGVGEDMRAAQQRFAAEQRERDVAARWAAMSPERRQALREDVEAIGRDAVIGLWRRLLADETFDLPQALEEP
jgi:hypothetical protein